MIDGFFFRFVLVSPAENCRFDGARRDFDKIPRILFRTVTVIIAIKWRIDKILWEVAVLLGILAIVIKPLTGKI